MLKGGQVIDITHRGWCFPPVPDEFFYTKKWYCFCKTFEKIHMATKKKAAAKKKTTGKKAGSLKKNKLGVKNSLVNNINARKKKGTARPKKKSTIGKKNYSDMQDNWDKAKKK